MIMHQCVNTTQITSQLAKWFEFCVDQLGQVITAVASVLLYMSVTFQQIDNPAITYYLHNA